MGIYSGGAGQPDALIAQSLVVLGGLGWNEISIPQTNLTAGTAES